MAVREPFSGLDEFFFYKNKLAEDLMTNERILELLDHENIGLKPDELMYNCVYPYEYVPNVTENTTTYICFDVDITKVPNTTYLLPSIYIWVFTHDSLMRLPGGGLRVDAIVSQIDRTINGSREYGLGRLELDTIKRYSPIQHYQGRIMKYAATDWNRPKAGRDHNDLPSNRRAR